MGGFFGVASKQDCVFDLFFGIDYHSHLGTRRGGMTVYGEDGFNRSIHNIENSPFRTKFDKDFQEMKGMCHCASAQAVSGFIYCDRVLHFVDFVYDSDGYIFRSFQHIYRIVIL